MRTNVEPSVHASRSLADTDPAVREALDNEARRQRNQIELIASENLMSRAVREALGQPLEANLDGISDPDGRPTDITYRWLTVSTLPGTIDDATGSDLPSNRRSGRRAAPSRGEVHRRSRPRRRPVDQ